MPLLKRNELKGFPFDEDGIGYDGWNSIDKDLHNFTHGDAVAEVIEEMKFQKYLELLDRRKEILKSI